MRSWFDMARLLPLEATRSIIQFRKSPASDRCGHLFLRSFDRFEDNAARFRSISPLADPHPLVALEILIVGEEMLDLLEHDRGEVLPLADIRIIREGRIDRHADQFFIAAVLV